MKQAQMLMTGIDSELSRAADSYLETARMLNDMEENLLHRKKELIGIMKKSNKTTFIHEGRRFIFRKGRRVESQIVLKNG